MKCFAPILALICLGTLAARGAEPPARPVLTLAPEVKRGNDGIFEIPCATGIVANGESHMAHVEETRLLNCQGARLYLWVAGWNDSNKLGKEGVAKALAPDFDQSIPKLFDKLLFNDPVARTRSGKNLNGEFWQLEQLQAWNLRRNIVLQLTQPHPRGPEDFAQFAKMYGASVREVKKRFPDLGPLYVMTFNEPDYEYPRHWDSRNREESVKLFMDLHKYLRAELKKEFPDVTLVGPGISLFMNWDRWEYWTKPFVQQVPEDALFNCQPYACSQDDLAAWAAMLKAESLRVNGHPLPLFMTETNTDLEPAAKDWWEDSANVRRVSEETQAVLGAMQRPDLFAFKFYFYYHYLTKHFDMWFKLPDGSYKPSPVYWVYYLLRDLRGQRVYAEIDREEARDLSCIASLNGQDLALAVYNNSARKRSVTLDYRRPQGLADSSVVIESLVYDGSKFVLDTRGLPTAPATLTLAPGELKKLRWTLSPTAALLTQARNEQEYMARETAVEVKPGQPVTLSIACPLPGPATRTRLRAGLFLDDVLAVQEVAFTVNGTRFAAPAHPDSYGKREKRPIELPEIWLPRELLRAQNQIVFEAPESGSYRVMFASLAQLEAPAGAPAWVPDLALQAPPAPLKATLVLPPIVAPGETTATVKLGNLAQTPLAPTLKWTLPAGWTLAGAPAAALSLAPGESQELAVKLASPPGRWRGPANFAVEARTADGIAANARRGAFFQVPLQAEAAAQPPVLDGKLDEWSPAAFVPVRQAGPSIPKAYQTRVAAQWDARYLYLALQCDGRALNPPPPEAIPWAYDVFELFLDFANQRRGIRDHRCMQVWTPLRPGADGLAFNNCPNDPNGVFLKSRPAKDDRGFVAAGTEGFVVELAFAWENMTGSEWTPAHERFAPKAGAVLGCELAMANRSLLGGVAKEWSVPAKWGLLELLAPGAKAAAPAAPVDSEPALQEEAAQGSGEAAAFSLRLVPGQSTDGWRIPAGVAAGGLLKLSNTAQHTVVAEDPAPSFVSPAGMTVSIGINGFEPDPAKVPEGKSYNIDMRAFISPKLPAAWFDPWSLPDCVLLKVAHTATGAVVNVYGKEGATKGGYGQLLCEARVEKLPARFSLWLDGTNFRLGSSVPLQLQTGSLSGKHNLTAKLWAGQLRYGFKAMWGDAAFVKVSEFALTAGREEAQK